MGGLTACLCKPQSECSAGVKASGAVSGCPGCKNVRIQSEMRAEHGRVGNGPRAPKFDTRCWSENQPGHNPYNDDARRHARVELSNMYS